jgi:quinol monooxygenase YgiN
VTGAGVLVTVDVRTKRGRRQDALEWFARNLGDTRAKPGCREVLAFTDHDDPDRIVIVERWDERAQHEEYARWRAAQPSRAELVELLAEPVIVRYFDPEDV